MFEGVGGRRAGELLSLGAGEKEVDA